MKTTKIRTVSELLKYYLHRYVEEHCLDYERQRYACRPLTALMGHVAITDLRADTIQQYQQLRETGGEELRSVSLSTIRRELGTLISALNFAVSQRIISENQFPKIKLPPSAPPKDIWLEEAELDAFVELAKTFNRERMSRIYRFVMLASETGARKNSILTLKWTQVSMSAGLIEFDRDEKRQKNKRRVKVPISDRLKPILAQARAERQHESEYVLDSPFSIQHAWDDLRDLAIEKLGKKFADVTAHTLRHTLATLMAKNNVSLREIAGVLGASEKTIEKVYAHHSPNYLRAAVNFRKKKS